MSALVLDFKQPKVKGTQPRLLEQPRYFCTAQGCDSDEFKIMADETVRCARCERRIRNLRVACAEQA